MEPQNSHAPRLSPAGVERALVEAEKLRKKKAYKAAIDLLVDALEAGLLKPAIYYRLGNVYYDAGKLDLAEYAYKRAIQFQPDHANAHHNLAVVYRRMGNIEASVHMRRNAYRLELRQGRRRSELAPDQRRWLRGIALRMFLLTVAVVIAVWLAIYLLAGF